MEINQVLARVSRMEEIVHRMEQSLRRLSDSVQDASQKLCHLIEAKRKNRRSHDADACDELQY
ncbi:hypothetical protein ACFL2T_00720 [Elusimicrobiota bacterium]